MRSLPAKQLEALLNHKLSMEFPGARVWIKFVGQENFRLECEGGSPETDGATDQIASQVRNWFPGIQLRVEKHIPTEADQMGVYRKRRSGSGNAGSGNDSGGVDLGRSLRIAAWVSAITFTVVLIVRLVALAH